MPGGWMHPGPQQRVAVYPQPAWASSTWKLAARVESLSSAGAACSPTTGLDVFADHRSGCIRPQQVWMYSPTTGLDVFDDDRSRRDGCIGRRAPGASEPVSARTQDRGHPRLLSAPGAAPHFAAVHIRPRRRQAAATAHGRRARRTGTCRAALERPARIRARARCRGDPRPPPAPGAAPHFATVHTRPRSRPGVDTAHGRRAQRAGTCRAALERPARACMDFFPTKERERE